MERIHELIAFLQLITALGGAARIAYCCIVATTDKEEAAAMKVRIRNIVVFVILAELVTTLIQIFSSYFA